MTRICACFGLTIQFNVQTTGRVSAGGAHAAVVTRRKSARVNSDLASIPSEPGCTLAGKMTVRRMARSLVLAWGAGAVITLYALFATIAGSEMWWTVALEATSCFFAACRLVTLRGCRGITPLHLSLALRSFPALRANAEEAARLVLACSAVLAWFLLALILVHCTILPTETGRALACIRI